MSGDIDLLSRLSEAKRAVLNDAPAGWFLVSELGWADNVKAGGHLQALFRLGFFERKSEMRGPQKPRYCLTKLGEVCQARLKDKEHGEAGVFNCVKADLGRAFAAPEATFAPLNPEAFLAGKVLPEGEGLIEPSPNLGSA